MNIPSNIDIDSRNSKGKFWPGMREKGGMKYTYPQSPNNSKNTHDICKMEIQSIVNGEVEWLVGKLVEEDGREGVGC